MAQGASRRQNRPENDPFGSKSHDSRTVAARTDARCEQAGACPKKRKLTAARSGAADPPGERMTEDGIEIGSGALRRRRRALGTSPVRPALSGPGDLGAGPGLAFEAARRIATGSRDREDFLAIFAWKTRGSVQAGAQHGPRDRRRARSSSGGRGHKAAVAVRTGLAGAGVRLRDPVTIIDFRALWSLGRRARHLSIISPPAAGSRPMPAPICARWTVHYGDTRRRISRRPANSRAE
jgi:hypothetical protein